MIGFNGYLEESRQIKKASERLAKDSRVVNAVRRHATSTSFVFMNALLAIPLVNRLIFDVSPQKLNTAGQVASNLRRMILGEEYGIRDDDMNQFLTEAFDKPYKWKNVGDSVAPNTRIKIRSKSDLENSKAYTGLYRFTADDKRKFEVEFATYVGPQKLYNRAELEPGFVITMIEFSDESPFGARYGISGKGDAMRIFATILDIIFDYTGRIEPDMIEFSGDKVDFDRKTQETRQTNRIALYKALIKRYASKHGYSLVKAVDKEDEMIFQLKRI